MPEKHYVPRSYEIQKIEYQPRMDMRLMHEWAERIPTFSENDPEKPEWQATPVTELDLSKRGYGLVQVKDESQNPTGTIKDRAAWELATLYRDFSRALYMKHKAGYLSDHEINTMPIPRLTLLTAGNEGHAVAEMFKKYELPPPKILVGMDTRPAIVESLKKDRMDIYQADLSHKLSAAEIQRLTGNEGGIDITSLRYNQPERVFYDWHVHEAFNTNADEIYIPYGSGRLMANYLYWQARSFYGEKPDPRLKIGVEKLINTNILGAEPKHPSVADKLSAAHKPFSIFEPADIQAAVRLHSTGKNTGKYTIADERIQQAYHILKSAGINSELSAAAGLALYLERYDTGETNDSKKALVVNTGSGLADHSDAIYNSESVH